MSVNKRANEDVYQWELWFMLSYYDINLNEIKRFWWNDWVAMTNRVIIGMYADTITYRVLIDRINSSHTIPPCK